MTVIPIRDVRALDAQDLHRCIREMADVFDSAEWRDTALTGAVVASALRKASAVGTKRGSSLSQRLRAVIRRNVRRRLVPDVDERRQPGHPTTSS